MELPQASSGFAAFAGTRNAAGGPAQPRCARQRGTSPAPAAAPGGPVPIPPAPARPPRPVAGRYHPDRGFDPVGKSPVAGALANIGAASAMFVSRSTCRRARRRPACGTGRGIVAAALPVAGAGCLIVRAGGSDRKPVPGRVPVGAGSAGMFAAIARGPRYCTCNLARVVDPESGGLVSAGLTVVLIFYVTARRYAHGVFAMAVGLARRRLAATIQIHMVFR